MWFGFDSWPELLNAACAAGKGGEKYKEDYFKKKKGGGEVLHRLTAFLAVPSLQSFGELVHKPLLVDLTVEEGQRLKVIYGSCAGFHAVDVDSGSVYDIYLPTHVRKNPHSMVG